MNSKAIVFVTMLLSLAVIASGMFALLPALMVAGGMLTFFAMRREHFENEVRAKMREEAFLAQFTHAHNV